MMKHICRITIIRFDQFQGNIKRGYSNNSTLEYRKIVINPLILYISVINNLFPLKKFYELPFMANNLINKEQKFSQKGIMNFVPFKHLTVDPFFHKDGSINQQYHKYKQFQELQDSFYSFNFQKEYKYVFYLNDLELLAQTQNSLSRKSNSCNQFRIHKGLFTKVFHFIEQNQINFTLCSEIIKDKNFILQPYLIVSKMRYYIPISVYLPPNQICLNTCVCIINYGLCDKLESLIIDSSANHRFYGCPLFSELEYVTDVSQRRIIEH
ncbi:hypothetical protein pb186bvf_005905 [Paramecium bursaria]